MSNEKRGSQALIQTMINQGVKYVFGIPGAKVDQLFEDLTYSDDPRTPKLIVARHEQNAAFIAAGIGRLTGKPGVVATTSGPGVSNLVTGLITATTEADPVVALGGQVLRDDLARLTHQSIPSKELMANATKSSVEVQDANNLSEAFANAYQSAISPKAGAAFISLPADVLSDKVNRPEVKPLTKHENGRAADATLDQIIELLKHAKLPVILAGMRASTPENTAAIRSLLKKFPLPVVETYQGAGIISHELEDDFFGRVGLFRNQIGDTLLKRSDLVVSIGYDPVEYEARNWNVDRTGKVVNIDDVAPEISKDYQPDVIVVADIAGSLDALADRLPGEFKLSADTSKTLDNLRQEFDSENKVPTDVKPGTVHPLAIVRALQERVDDDTTVTVDVGSHYIWMARHFRIYKPRHLLFSNGMQTLGVSLPWAIAAALVRPGKPVVSVSGDGGFLFSGQELETAVRLNLNIVQLIWNDGYYDMVKFQEIAKYGKPAGVQFGPVDYVKYAESFGARGLRVTSPDDLGTTLDQAFKTKGPVIVDIPVDYSDNIKLKSALLKDILN
ncbi:Acetolactate synthase, catabolic (plasmid) [Pediococcus damnosus]|uniref:acetolactate synthase AlsS n=1 Tax=Pediococcus damnosus TaxID=51663 RepID=UPI00078B515B|nr:acetolactate synthase AlsS [Pediococcus damnosus]AMV61726.1 Acetolactate synthase, catabolic [Pediococcus damnosus]AMV66066.1 Acetolactate synthase, catabolic [Pediococcus damnosus]